MMRYPVSWLLAASIALAAWIPAPVNARPLKISTFHYYRTVQLSPTTGTAAYGRILLDETIALHASGNDLRVALNGETVPHFTRVREVNAFSKGSATIIHQQRTATSVIYVLQVNAPPQGMVPIELEIMGDSHFETAARLQSGSRPGEWHEAGHASVYRYDGQPARLRLPDAGPYYRIEFEEKRDYTFPAVRYAPARTEAEFRIVPGSDWRQDADRDEQATVFYFKNPSHRRLSRLSLQFQEERYRRTLTVSRFDRSSKSYVTYFSALLFRRGGNPIQSIEFPGSTSDPLKIVIADGDDAPLHLQEALFFGPMEELVFLIPPREDETTVSENLRLYYGNPYAASPQFDLQQSFEPSLRLADAALGPEQANEAFAYSVVEPPVSTWVIRILFLAGLAALAYPAWRILSRYAEGIGGGRGGS